MLINNTAYKEQYTANGATVEFAITFPFFDSSHVKVFTSDADSEEATLVESTQYTITGAGSESGGTLTFATAPTSGLTIAILRDMPITQTYEYTELDNFPAKSHENALAKLTMICQEIKEEADRSIKVPATSTNPAEDFALQLFEASANAQQSASAAAVSASSAEEAKGSVVVLANTAKAEITALKVEELADASAALDSMVDDAEDDFEAAVNIKTTAALALVDVEVAKAEAAADNAASSASAAASSEASAAAYTLSAASNATNAANSATAAEVSYQAAEFAQTAAETAQEDAEVAKNTAVAAKQGAAASELAAAASETNAAASEGQASAYASAARADALAAASSEASALSSKTAAATSESAAQAWAEQASEIVGTGLPVATENVLGGIKASASLSVTTTGVASVPQASTTVAGIAKLATSSQAAAGADTSTIMTPAGVAAQLSPVISDVATAQSTADTAVTNAANAQSTANTIATTEVLGRVKVNGGLSITATGDLSISADVQEVLDDASALLDDVSINAAALSVVRSNSSGKIEVAYLPPLSGASSAADGSAGIVPQPVAGDEKKVLYGDGSFKDVAALPVGLVACVATSTIPAGWLRYGTGMTLTGCNAAYPDFYNYVADSNNTCTLSAYEATLALTGQCGAFGIDEDTGTVRMPTVKFIQNALGDDSIGTVNEAGLPNITGSINAGRSGFYNATGAFTGYAENGYSEGALAESGLGGLFIDAANCSSIYGNSTTVQPDSVSHYYIIYAYNAAVSASVAQAAEFTQLLDAKADVDKGIPSGVIVMWSGTTSTIPAGWALCDGTGITPDLRDRFVVGAGSTFEVGTTGGSLVTGATTLTISQMPSHAHTGGAAMQHTSVPVLSTAYCVAATNTGATGSSQAHTHPQNRPPYYALAFIMKL